MDNTQAWNEKCVKDSYETDISLSVHPLHVKRPKSVSKSLTQTRAGGARLEPVASTPLNFNERLTPGINL